MNVSLPDTHPGAGELVGGRYRLSAHIGPDAPAEVWSAYDERLRRFVTLKILADRGEDARAAFVSATLRLEALSGPSASHLLGIDDTTELTVAVFAHVADEPERPVAVPVTTVAAQVEAFAPAPTPDAAETDDLVIPSAPLVPFDAAIAPTAAPAVTPMFVAPAPQTRSLVPPRRSGAAAAIRTVFATALAVAMIVVPPFGEVDVSDVVTVAEQRVQLAPASFALPPFESYAASFETESPFPTVPAGGHVEWVLALRNTGTAGWYLGVDGAQASLALGDGTIAAVQTTPYVGPGQVGWFVTKFRAPSDPGAHRVDLFPHIEGRGRLPDLGLYTVVTVAR